MPDTRMVIIRHPSTGQEAAILPADFTRKNAHPRGAGSYAEQGYMIDRYEDGSAFEGPKSQREIDKAAEERAAAREAPKTRAKD